MSQQPRDLVYAFNETSLEEAMKDIIERPTAFAVYLTYKIKGLMECKKEVADENFLSDIEFLAEEAQLFVEVNREDFSLLVTQVAEKSDTLRALSGRHFIGVETAPIKSILKECFDYKKSSPPDLSPKG